MEKLSSKYEHDSQAYNDKRSEIHRRPKTLTDHKGIDGSYGGVPFEVAMKTPDKRHGTNYRLHKKLVDDIDFWKVHESKPRSEREFKERSYYGWLGRLGNVSHSGAELLTREATKNLEEHNKAIKDAYRIGTLLNDSAYDKATNEDKNREAGKDLGSLVNKGSIDFSRLVKKQISESASIFDKLDLVRERAYEFAGLNSRQYVIKGDTSTIVIGNSSEYVPETWDKMDKMGTSGGYTINTSSAFKLSVMEADKRGKDKMVVDVFKFYESQNYYCPVSRTTLLENDTATIEKYDDETAEYSAPKKLSKSEVQSMYSHLILGDNILGE